VLPPGAWLFGSADALGVVLSAVSELRGTEAARFAQQAQRRIASCSEILAHALQPAELLAALRCRAADETIPAPLERLRGETSLAWSVELGNDRLPLRGSATVATDGGIRATLSFTPGSQAGLARWVVPGERAAGATRLAARDALIHARLRPAGGLDVASEVASGGQADRLFQLGSALFTGAALAGSWELVVYPPKQGEALPPLALGLDLLLPDAARLGVDRFVADLEAAWPIRHQPARFALAGGRELSGACFFELRILPEFAPCWVVDADLLVVGWNGRSLERALSDDAQRAAPLDGAVLALDRWPAAERALGGDGAAYPWRRIEIDARRGAGAEADAVVLALRAEAGSQP
jgi:hypothetical protein